MKMPCQLVVLVLILQGVIAPDPFNQFMRQHYNQRGLQTPGTSGLSYSQYSAPGSTFTSGTPGQVSGISQNPGSNQQPISSGNTITFGFETQKQTAGFQISPVPGPKLLPLQATAQTNNLITGVGTPIKTSPLQPSQTLNQNISLTASGPSPQASNKSPSGLNQTPLGYPTRTSNHLSGPSQLPVGTAQPVNQPQSMRSLLMPPTQPQIVSSGQPVQTISGSAPPLQTRLPAQNLNVAGKLYPGLVNSMTDPTLTSGAAQPPTSGAQPLPRRIQQFPKGSQTLLPRTQAFPTGTQHSPAYTQPKTITSRTTNPMLPKLLPANILTMSKIPQLHSLQSPHRSQALQTDSSFFLPPLQQTNIQLPLGAAKPSPFFSQQMNTAIHTLPSFSSPPLTYNPSRLEKWAIKSYTDDSAAKPRTLKQKSYLQLIAKRRRALANQQLSQALFIQPGTNNVQTEFNRVMPDFLALNAARDLDCETMPEVRGLDVHKYHPMGCDDDHCPPGKECRTLRGVGMCCPPSVTSQAIQRKSSVGTFDYLELF